MTATKIATCCYCGTRAALVLRGKNRHELACSSCGAPLRAMKMLRSEPDRATAPAATPARPDHRAAPQRGRYARPAKYRKRKKTKGLLRKVFEEIWDELEDIFD